MESIVAILVFGLLGVALFIAATVALRAARNIHGPEGTLAMAMLGIVLGYGLWFGAIAFGAALPHQMLVRLSVAGQLAVASGAGLLYLGAWKIFRHTSKLAGGVSAIAGIAVVGCWLAIALERRPVELGHADPLTSLFVLLQAGALGSWSVESWLHASKLRKRQNLGLAEPHQRLRFTRMARGSLGIAGVLLIVLGCGWLVGQPPRKLPIAMLSIALLAGSSVLDFYRAFFERAQRSGEAGTRAEGLGDSG